MHSNFRTCLAITLAVLLILTSQGVAIARGMPSAAGQIVICTGTGPVLITIDENGEPSESPRICPDTGQALLAAVALADVPETPPGHVRARTPTFSQDLVLEHRSGTALARGPPV